MSYIAEPLQALAVPIDSVVLDPKNARKHGEENLATIRSSLNRFGQRLPIVVQRDGMIVRAGNGRVEAARAMGWTHIAAVVVDDENDAAAAFAIVDNQSALLAEWDDEKLAAVLRSLPDDLRVDVGFNPDALAEALSPGTKVGLTDPDDVPEVPTNPITKPGDLWVLGGHRLLCGDCTVHADVDNVTRGTSCDVCLTDPPYGCGEAYVTHDDTQESLSSLASMFFPIAQSKAKVVAITPGIQNIRHYPHADWMLCWFYGVGTGRTPWGFTCWQPVCVWGKDPMLAAGDGCHPDGISKLMTSEDAAINRELSHACPKPLSVWCWFMERLSHRGDSVYEPFSGSGTTIIAAEQLGRRCYAIEISPQYVDVAVQRWEKFTGRKAERVKKK